MGRTSYNLRTLDSAMRALQRPQPRAATTVRQWYTGATMRPWATRAPQP